MTSSNGSIFRVTGPLCGEVTGPGEFPTQRPVTRSFDVSFDLRLNKRLSKQPWGWWLETPLWSLWRQCYAVWLDFLKDMSNVRHGCEIGKGSHLYSAKLWPSDAIWRQRSGLIWAQVMTSSVKSSDIHIRASSQEMPQPPITKVCLKITCLTFHSNFPGANELEAKIFLRSSNKLVQHSEGDYIRCNHVYSSLIPVCSDNTIRRV